MSPRHARRITRRMIEQLQQGRAPWLAPWSSPTPPPYNPISGHPYRGINSLWLDAQHQRDPRWLTAAQARALGAHIKPGAQGTEILYWKRYDTQVLSDANGRPRTVQTALEKPRAHMLTVFNAAEIDGLPPPAIPPPAPDLHARIEAIFTHSGTEIVHIPGSKPHYRPGPDQIVLPPRAEVASADHYYANALYALLQWTGHPSRLNRELQHPIGSEHHAREALRTDIAAWMLSQRLGIAAEQDTPGHTANVRAWVRLLDKDPRELFRAAADAEKMAEVVTGFGRARQHEHSQDQSQSSELPGRDLTDRYLQEQMRLAKRQAQQHAEDLLTLARVREQQAHHEMTGSADDTAIAHERQTSAEVVTLASDRLTEIRAEARDALTAGHDTPRPVAVTAATTTATNEHLRERVKRERQEVHHDAPDAHLSGGRAAHERTWWELSQPERQRIIDAVKAGRSVTLPRDTPSELRTPVVGPDIPFPLFRASRSRERDADF